MDAKIYKAIIEQSSVMMIVMDTDLKIAVVSDAYLNNTKTIRENIVGKNIFDVFPNNANETTEEIVDTIQNSFNHILKKKNDGTLVTNYTITKPELEERILRNNWRVSHTCVLDEFNNVKYIIQRLEEATENEVLIAQLEAEEKTLKSIEENIKRSNKMLMESPFAFSIMKGKEMRITIANDLMKEFWGKGKQVEGKTLLELLPELRDQSFPALIDSVYTTGIPHYANEILAKLKHNNKIEERYFNIVYQPNYEADKTISGVTTIAYEVTEQVLTREKIQESEHRYQKMISTSPSMISILKGEELIVESANDSMLKAWGKGKEIIGKPLLQVLPEIIEQGFAEILHSVYKTGVSQQAHEMPFYIERNGKMELSYYTFVYQAQFNINGEIEGIAVISHEVTPQAKYNLEIKASEERFRQLVMQAPIAICVLRGKEYIIETINKDMVQMWDREMENVINKPAFDVLTELKEQGFKELLDNVYTTGERFATEELPINLRRNGTLENAFVKFVYEPLREADGTITGIMALAHEITNEVIAKKKMEAQALMHHNMLMTAPGFVCTLSGPNHVYELVNEKYQQLFGKRQIQGKPIMVALPELEGQGFDTLLDKIYITGETFVGFDIPVTLARDENEVPELRYFNFSYQPMYDENDKIYSILVFGYEVTELAIAKKRIEESEKQFRLLTNTMPQKITTADEEGNITFFNQKWLEDTGCTLEELKEWGWEKIVHYDDQEKTKKSWQQSVLTGNILDIECRILNKQGEYKWHLSRALPLKDENGKIKMWVGSHTEIHEQKEQKEELEKAVWHRTNELEQKNLELESVNKDLTSFTYVSSHDLQEPLRKIQNFITCIALEEKNLSETGKDYFIKVQQTAQRMQELIEDLLAYSRTKSADRNFKKTDLNIIVEEVKNNLEEAIQEKNAIINVINLCEVNIISFQFRQLLNNLISNSLKFSHPHLPPEITIECKTGKGNKLNKEKLLPEINYCHILYTDNGIGFDPQYKERIFEVFQRLHSQDKYKGTGIGLAICKRIIENHNGIITATGSLNKGATFDIYIPENSDLFSKE